MVRPRACSFEAPRHDCSAQSLFYRTLLQLALVSVRSTKPTYKNKHQPASRLSQTSSEGSAIGLLVITCRHRLYAVISYAGIGFTQSSLFGRWLVPSQTSSARCKHSYRTDVAFCPRFAVVYKIRYQTHNKIRALAHRAPLAPSRIRSSKHIMHRQPPRALVSPLMHSSFEARRRLQIVQNRRVFLCLMRADFRVFPPVFDVRIGTYNRRVHVS